MNKMNLLKASILFVFMGGYVQASQIDPDQLERIPITLSDGSTVYHVRYKNRNWRETPASILQAKAVNHSDVCFESKFSKVEEGKVKLFKQEGIILCNDPKLITYMNGINPTTNVWMCGTLRMRADRKGVEFDLVDICIMKDDLQRFKVKLGLYVKRKDIDALLELGDQVKQVLASSLFDFDKHDQFLEIRNTALTTALNLKQKALAKDDSDGLYAIAVMWKERVNKTHKYHELIRKILKMDPGHRKAGQIGLQEMNLVKFQGIWMSKEEKDVILKREKEEKTRLEEARLAALEAKKQAKLAAIQNRNSLLAQHQQALRTKKLKDLEEAIENLGKAIRHSPDPGFGRMGIEILANMGDPAAIFPGLAEAAKTLLPEVRAHAYQALAYVGNRTALQIFSSTLSKENERKAAEQAVRALVQRRELGKPVVAVLVENLQKENPGIEPQLVKGLQVYTGLKHASKTAWIDWWSTNKDNAAIPIAPVSGP